MKKYTIINVNQIIETGENEDLRLNMFECEGDDTMQVSDGYHTMDELYAHRVQLWITVCSLIQGNPAYQYVSVWRSKIHSDGSSFNGWFVLGITKRDGEQLSYHLPMSKWEETNFALILDKAPEYDGHTSADVLERLKKL